MDQPNATTAPGVPPVSERVAFFDVVRGFSVISMVLFHLCYDLRFLYGQPLAFFRPPLQDIWRSSISWAFLFVAGCMCSYSRHGGKRALRYLGVAALIYVVTKIVAVDTPISFGIIYCMGFSTLVQFALSECSLEPDGWVSAIVLFILFVLCLGIPHGYVGIGSVRFALPAALYQTTHLSFLGFPGPGFASGDYYPPLPYTLMYLCGSAVGFELRHSSCPSWIRHVACAPLEAVGRHALPVYILHQPIILAALSLIYR